MHPNVLQLTETYTTLQLIVTAPTTTSRSLLVTQGRCTVVRDETYKSENKHEIGPFVVKVCIYEQNKSECVSQLDIHKTPKKSHFLISTLADATFIERVNSHVSSCYLATSSHLFLQS